MSTPFSSWFSSVLDLKPVSRIRRNHGLEHATLHVLSERFPRTSLAGHSDAGGFWILGDISQDDLQEAVTTALARLKSGEVELAVHPNCGTNFVTSGTFAGIAASMAMFGAGKRMRDKLERVPLAASLATLALVAAQPLGLYLQEKYTTSGIPGDLKIVEISQSPRKQINAYRVSTRG
jgi:Domain of unknown function (DUF6391)